MNNKKIVLLDGMSLLCRSFFAIPMLSNSKGIHTNAVYGFLNMMFKFLEEENPNYLVVAFDVNHPTFRHVIYPDYKGTRGTMEPELYEQIPMIKNLLQAMNIKIIEQPGLEADDLIGTLSARAELEGYDVVIVSGDRDLLQLATEKIKIRIPKTYKGKTVVEDYYAIDVKERYGVTPSEYISVKALMGDTSDNIPGVPGIGEKTATKIIAEYGSIHKAYENVDNLKPPKASKALKESYELAKICEFLVTIKKDADVKMELKNTEITDLYTKEAYDLLEELELKSIIKRFSEKGEK